MHTTSLKLKTHTHPKHILMHVCSMLPWARVFAAIVPALNAVRLLAVGTGTVQDAGLVASVSRSGVSREKELCWMLLLQS